MNRLPLYLWSPARIAATLLAFVCVAELVIMGAIGRLSHRLPWWGLTAIDAIALTALASLFVWWRVIAPLRAALEREQHRVRAVLDNAAEAVITIDQHGMIRDFNRAAERIFGYRAAEAVGQNIRIIVPHRFKGKHEEHLRRYAATGESQVLNTRREVTALRRDGSEFPVDLSMSEAQVNGDRLITAILLDISERRALEERIHRMAHYDDLTGLPNRALYFDQLERALALAHRQQHKVGVLFIDLNDFKPVNDEFGHATGDDLLRLVAGRLAACMRESDMVARLGGDEFTVILPAIQGLADAEEAAQRVAAAFRETFIVGGRPITVGFSVGVALYPEDGLTASEITHRADVRMYRAKEASRVTVDGPAVHHENDSS